MSREVLIKSAKLHSYKPEILEKVLRLIEVLGQFAAVPFLNDRLVLKGRLHIQKRFDASE